MLWALCVCLAAACAPRPFGPTPLRAGPEQARLGVQALLDALIAADNAGDPARVAELYSEDAVQLPWFGPSLVGRRAIQARYAEIFASVEMDLRLTAHELVASEDGWGYVLGSTHATLRPRAGGVAQLADDKFVMIVTRTEQGWRIARLSWSPLQGARAQSE